MKLHEAIVEILSQSKRPLTCSEIADKINSLKLYERKGGGLVDGSQINARINKYKSLFKRDESTSPMTIVLNSQADC